LIDYLLLQQRTRSLCSSGAGDLLTVVNEHHRGYPVARICLLAMGLVRQICQLRLVAFFITWSGRVAA
jgi:hypothetical protein